MSEPDCVIRDECVTMTELMKILSEKFERIETKLDMICERLDKIEPASIRMDKHIDFVETVIERVDNIRPTNLLRSFIPDIGMICFR